MVEHRIIQGDCIETLKTLASESVHCCVTSPPYFGLRDYQVDGQIGLEATPQEFIAAMVTVFEEVRRVLRPDGVLFLNLGDSYAGSGNGSNDYRDEGSSLSLNANKYRRHKPQSRGFKPKDLMMMPHRVAIALQEAGWWVRSDMPWVKRSAMPESVTDRPAKALEYVFMLTKSERYFYDAEAVRIGSSWDPNNTKFPDGWDTGEGGHGSFHRNGREKGKAVKLPDTWKGSSFSKGKTAEHQLGRAQKDRDRSFAHSRNGEGGHLDETPAGSRNFRNADLWFSSIKEPHGLVSIGDELVGLDVNPSGFKDAHFATFPPKLIEPLIKAGTSEHGCCADCGAPYERKVEKETNTALRNLAGKNDSEYQRSRVTARGSEFGDFHDLGSVSTTFLGWQKTCKCKTDERVPCTVLDPFAGAGTTLLVSKRLGRCSIGLELNPDYIKIAEHRLEHWHRANPPKAEPEPELGPLFAQAKTDQNLIATEGENG